MFLVLTKVKVGHDNCQIAFYWSNKESTYCAGKSSVRTFLFSVSWECLITCIILESPLSVPLLLICHTFWVYFTPGEPEIFFFLSYFRHRGHSNLLSTLSCAGFLPSSVGFLLFLSSFILICMLWVISFVCALMKCLLFCVHYFKYI